MKVFQKNDYTIEMSACSWYGGLILSGLFLMIITPIAIILYLLDIILPKTEMQENATGQ